MKKKAIFSFFLVVYYLIFAQIDKKQILLRKADQLTSRRKFESANKIYEDILEKDPSD